jgi:hypothetical protein
MTSSRFIPIYDGALVEYVYADPVSPLTYSTNTLPIEILKDSYTSNTYVFNPPAYGDISHNTRSISAVPIDSSYNSFASLTTSRSISYNDVDPNLTPNDQVLQSFSPAVNIVYDKIKIHFAAGFNFDNYDGFVFQVNYQRRDSVNSGLASRVYLKTDTPNLNPRPFMIGERLYSTYIEMDIPALKYVIDAFVANPTSTNTLGYKLTEGKGFIKTSTIDITAFGIYKTTKEQGFPIYAVRNLTSVSLPQTDPFNLLVAVIQQSTSGDYFELYGEYAGQIFADFMASLNSQPNGNWIAIHQIDMKEQIGTRYVTTASQMITQLDNYDLPTIYRPVVMNSSVAVSFTVDYILRIVNRDTQEQIIRNATITSRDVGVYGRKLQKIYLGKVPEVVKIYNKVVDDSKTTIVVGGDTVNVQQNQSGQVAGTPVQTQVVVNTVYRDRSTVLAKISPVTLTVNQNAGG